MDILVLLKHLLLYTYTTANKGYVCKHAISYIGCGLSPHSRMTGYENVCIDNFNEHFQISFGDIVEDWGGGKGLRNPVTQFLADLQH